MEDDQLIDLENTKRGKEEREERIKEKDSTEKRKEGRQ